MSKYKILVKSVEEVEKAQTLFEKLGFRKGECTAYDLPKLIVAQTNEPHFGTYSSGASLYFDRKNEYEWLSMEQLEDLVKGLNDLEDSELVAQSESNEQGLISNQDALIALANGQEVEGFSDEHERWIPMVYFTVQEVMNGSYKFRLKPRTVKLEIEVPAPFEPKVGELFYYISTETDSGFDSKKYDEQYPHFDKEKIIYGAWRTEAEIKIVVEQLSKLGVLK